MTLSNSPIYNLGAVLKETGLAADTLRAWERRYGVPMPQRTPGGHRLYSDRDIRLIKWLQGRQAQGLSISRAVKQWNDLLAAGADPLQEAAVATAFVQVSTPQDNLAALREQWLSACLAFDEAAAEQVLNDAYSQHSVETVAEEIILRALHNVGEMWVKGTASVQQEHFLTRLSVRRLDALIEAAPAPVHAPPILLACAKGDPHLLPLLYLNLLLRRRGRSVVFLGTDVPTQPIAEAARATNAALVVLSAERLVTAVKLQDEAAFLAKKRVPVAYGGRIFIQEPELQRQIPAVYLGDNLQGAIERIEHLLDGREPTNRRAPAIPEHNSAPFREALPRIERDVFQHFSKTAVPTRLVTVANSHFSAAVASALDFGNVKYVQSDMEWIRTLLTEQGLPLKILRDYLHVYADAIRRVMGAAGKDLTGWIREQAALV